MRLENSIKCSVSGINYNQLKFIIKTSNRQYIAINQQAIFLNQILVSFYYTFTQILRAINYIISLSKFNRQLRRL